MDVNLCPQGGCVACGGDGGRPGEGNGGRPGDRDGSHPGDGALCEVGWKRSP